MRRSEPEASQALGANLSTLQRKVEPGHEAGRKLQTAKLRTLNPNPEGFGVDLIVVEAELGGRGRQRSAHMPSAVCQPAAATHHQPSQAGSPSRGSTLNPAHQHISAPHAMWQTGDVCQSGTATR